MTAFVKKLNPALLLLLLAVGMLCPLPAAAAAYEVDAQIPVSVDVTENYQTAFTLQLTAEDDAPLPRQTSLTFTGGGSGAFGPIHYTAPGDYRYQVTQAAGTDSYVTYDGSVYTVTVRVTDTPDGGLQAEVWARHGDAEGKSDVVAFHNGYEAPAADDSNTDQGNNGANGNGTAAQQTAAAVQTPAATPVPPAAVPGPALSGLLPQTGDTFPLVGLVILCGIAALGLGYGLWRKTHHKS